MKNKKQQIPVQVLHTDRNQNRYKNIIWITFLALLLTGGTFLIIRETWKGQISMLPGCLLAAASGILCGVLSEITQEKSRFSMGIMVIPWILLLFVTGFFQGGWRGAQAWLNMLISQWNAVNKGGTALFSVQASTQDALVFTQILVLAVAEIAWLLVVHRHIVLGNLAVFFWIILQLLCGTLNPVACGFLLAGLCGLWISDKEMNITRNRAVWTAGILAVFCGFGTFASARELPSVDSFRESVQETVHRFRYGEDTLPEGNLYQASELKANGKEMLKVQTEQKKNLYLRGFVGSVYNGGVWEEPTDSVYGGENTGMLKWLSKNSFDPLRQTAEYYSYCDEEEQPEKNIVQVQVTGASRYYVYTPATLEKVNGGHISQEKDLRLFSRSFFGDRNYTLEEVSGTRPSELMVTDSWVSVPENTDQEKYSKSEAVYRAFVYDNYLAVDSETKDLIQKMFWDDYDPESDGIYSAACQIRDVLKKKVQYTENVEEVPDGEDPVRYFLEESGRGNAMLYASAAVDAFRVHGIPARYVEGYYIPGSTLEDKKGGAVSITGEDTHAWAEVYFDGMGWLPLDVTPGYYYDAVALQKMVNSPDIAQKNAVLKDNSAGSQQVTGMDSAGTKSTREKLKKVARDVAAICLGILALLVIIFAAVIVLAEGMRIILLWKDKKTEETVSGRERILRTEKKIYNYLAITGINARLGWNTQKTDEILQDRFAGIEAGEYTRVCGLIEKVIYGEIELEPYEERTVTRFLDKLLDGPENMDRKTWLKRRYLYVWKSRK